MIFELKPRFCKQKSFNGKAHVIQDGNNLKLQSYETIVATVERPGGVMIFHCDKKYSRTTMKHQKEFFKQLGLKDEQIKELYDKKVLEV